MNSWSLDTAISLLQIAEEEAQMGNFDEAVSAADEAQGFIGSWMQMAEQEWDAQEEAEG